MEGGTSGLSECIGSETCERVQVNFDALQSSGSVKILGRSFRQERQTEGGLTIYKVNSWNCKPSGQKWQCLLSGETTQQVCLFPLCWRGEQVYYHGPTWLPNLPNCKLRWGLLCKDWHRVSGWTSMPLRIVNEIVLLQAGSAASSKASTRGLFYWRPKGVLRMLLSKDHRSLHGISYLHAVWSYLWKHMWAHCSPI